MLRFKIDICLRCVVRRLIPSRNIARLKMINVLWLMCKYFLNLTSSSNLKFSIFSRQSCHSSWQTLRQSPIFGCICPNNLPNKKNCDKIFQTVNGNDCIGKYNHKPNPINRKCYQYPASFDNSNHIPNYNLHHNFVLWAQNSKFIATAAYNWVSRKIDDFSSSFLSVLHII